MFGGIPIAAERERLKCGVVVVDLRSGDLVASFYFQAGVTEIFAVELLPGLRCPAVVGPRPTDDESQPVWYVPGPVSHESNLSRSETDIAELVDRGDRHRQHAEWAAAAACYRQALLLSPELAEVTGNLAQVLQEQGRLDEAAAAYERALSIDPRQADLLMCYGGLLASADGHAEARSRFQQALEIEPENSFIHANLAQLLNNEGRIDAAARHFSESNRLQPITAARIASAMMLPPVYDSIDDLNERRTRLCDQIASLAAEGVTLDPANETVPHLFSPTYQGLNDREIYQAYAKLYQPSETIPLTRAAQTGKIRIGIFSAFFGLSSIGKLYQGLIEKLDRNRFHVIVLSTTFPNDPVSNKIQEHADTFLVIPEHLPTARRQIAELQLDVLLYTDIGTHAFPYSLAFSRLAPVQCVTWGHPQTTGIPTIDYFLSGEDLETSAGDAAYTETLVRLPGLQTYYRRPPFDEPTRGREFYQLPERAHLYGCPHSLFKFHPDFDQIVAGILRDDKRGHLVLLAGKYPYWQELLMKRWKRTMPDVMNRVQFLPRMPQTDFLNLIALCDVLLDPLHTGGFNISFEALSVGTPVVTLPSAFARGRMAFAQYRQMGFSDGIVETPEQYIELAVRLGSDIESRRRMSETICQASSVLWENADNIRAIEDFLTSVAR